MVNLWTKIFLYKLTPCEYYSMHRSVYRHFAVRGCDAALVFLPTRKLTEPP